ncbi:hypothetical protein IFR05_004968 [Cadophora sp. M221]|nr:hypothetical protein IFR05_004968 [Cadophora sp. M221]
MGATIASLQKLAPTCPAILTYDRFGQGLTTSRDPLDGQRGKELGHDFLDVANDLHEIILSVAASELGLQSPDVESGKARLLLVGASIGAPIARLYVQNHQGIVSGMIILDSNIANANYSDSLDFDGDSLLSDDCTLEQYRETRLKLTRMFDLKPKLVGIRKAGPLLSVVGHDPETFVDLSYDVMGTPKSLSKITNE